MCHATRGPPWIDGCHRQGCPCQSGTCIAALLLACIAVLLLSGGLACSVKWQHLHEVCGAMTDLASRFGFESRRGETEVCTGASDFERQSAVKELSSGGEPASRCLPDPPNADECRAGMKESNRWNAKEKRFQKWTKYFITLCSHLTQPRKLNNKGNGEVKG